MCVAILVPTPEEGKEHKPLSLEVLQACEKSNPAGGGIAYLTAPGQPQGVIFKKGIKADEIFEIQKNLKPPYQIHFRIPTIGGPDPALCHPFPISKKASVTLEGVAGVTLIHNGHWGNWRNTLLCLLQDKLPGNPWSDTRAMAYLVAWYGQEILSIVDEKVCLLGANGVYRFFGSGWQEHEGAYFSNLGWKHNLPSATPTYTRTYPYQSYTSVSDDTAPVTTLAAARANFKVVMNNVEVSVFGKSKEDADLISEWGKWVGVKGEALDKALGELRGAVVKAAEAKTKTEPTSEIRGNTLLM